MYNPNSLNKTDVPVSNMIHTIILNVVADLVTLALKMFSLEEFIIQLL